MSRAVEGGTVLAVGRPTEAVERMRKRRERQNLLVALALALALHGAVILGFWLADILGTTDMGDWSGPVLVKIGAPDAAESSKPDPGPLPEQTETAPEIPEEPLTQPEESSIPESAPERAESSPDGIPDRPVDQTGEGGSGEAVESPFAEPSGTSQPAPARVQGEEDGNNYFIDFEGYEDSEIGRTYSLDYVTSYMPLPKLLQPELVDKASSFTSKNGLNYNDLLQYWVENPIDGAFELKSEYVPYQARPFLWSYLTELGYNVADAEWKAFATGQVIVNFKVHPSSDGAFLDEFVIVEGTSSPEVNEAIKYGLSQWNFYNTTEIPIKGTLTYKFDR